MNPNDKIITYQIGNKQIDIGDFPRAQFLFHYTRKFDHLRDMLKNGLWPRFCIENFSWLFNQEVSIAFPLLSFCDIPPDVAYMHRERYGNYAIGFSKDLAGDLDIVPIWYVHVDTTIAKHLAKLFKPPKRRFNLNDIESLRPLLPFLKSTIGDQPDRTAQYRTESIMAFDEEMEWRYTPEILSSKWIAISSQRSVSDDDHNLSKEHRMVIKPNLISHVFVQSQKEVEDLIRDFPEIDPNAFQVKHLKQ